MTNQENKMKTLITRIPSQVREKLRERAYVERMTLLCRDLASLRGASNSRHAPVPVLGRAMLDASDEILHDDFQGRDRR
jgi:hypothetical protein